MHACALELELHLPSCRSLKAKRAVVRPIVERVRGRHPVAIGEVDGLDQWQRAVLGVAAVGAGPAAVTDQLDRVERLVWSSADIEVVRSDRTWLEVEQ